MMHRRALAARKLEARRALEESARILAERAEADEALVDALGVQNRRPEVEALFRLEATAALLGALVDAGALIPAEPEKPTRAEILAVVGDLDGLTKTSTEALEAWAAEAPGAPFDAPADEADEE